MQKQIEVEHGLSRELWSVMCNTLQDCEIKTLFSSVIITKCLKLDQIYQVS